MNMSNVRFPIGFHFLMSNFKDAQWEEDWHRMSHILLSVSFYSVSLNKSLEFL